MRWWVFVICAYITIGIEVSLRPVLEIGSTGVAPSIVVIYAAFLALHAPARAALWGCLILGLAVDLLNLPRGLHGAGDYILVGPYALGSTLACYSILQFRTLLVQRNAATLAFCVVLFSTLSQIVILAMLSLRDQLPWIEPTAWQLGPELLSRGGVSIYSALLALPCSFLLRLLIAAHDFPALHARWSGRFSRQ